MQNVEHFRRLLCSLYELLFSFSKAFNFKANEKFLQKYHFYTSDVLRSKKYKRFDKLHLNDTMKHYGFITRILTISNTNYSENNYASNK